MLATSGALTALRGESAAWRLEGKWDGTRAVADIAGTGLALRSGIDREITAAYPALANLLDLPNGRPVVLDGEIVAMDQTGRTDVVRLQQRMGLTRPADIERIRRQVPIAYLIFDAMALDG
ncbi:ATP-dependent DNA ligase [Nakamurella sp. UYEF19]|uniref:ATP-dependent DNA ligase n=1 Tax=Nakamurella sp. UYEF19 TaxID=1756392 RepID=UPI003396ED6C